MALKAIAFSVAVTLSWGTARSSDFTPCHYKGSPKELPGPLQIEWANRGWYISNSVTQQYALKLVRAG